MRYMPTKSYLAVPTALCLAMAACADDVPTRPEIEGTDADLAIGGPNAVASASGGANWDLNIGDLDGDGVDDPIGNVLGFNAVRYSDGTVKGQIEYQQSALGEFFRFHGPVTCIGVYDGGTRAKFGGLITRPDDPTIPTGLFMWFTVGIRQPRRQRHVSGAGGESGAVALRVGDTRRNVSGQSSVLVTGDAALRDHLGWKGDVQCTIDALRARAFQ